MTTSPAPASACRRAARLVTLPSTLTLADLARRPTTAGPTATPAPTGRSTSAALSMMATAALTAYLLGRPALQRACPHPDPVPQAGEGFMGLAVLSGLFSLAQAPAEGLQEAVRNLR